MGSRDLKHWGKIRNLSLLLKVNGEKYGKKAAFTQAGKVYYSYEELDLASRYVASLLHSAGIRKNDRAAILSENSSNWGTAYFGILVAGAITVPILPDFRGPDVQSILEHAEAKVLFASGKQLTRLEIVLPPSVEMVIRLDDFRIFPVKSGKILSGDKMVPSREKGAASEETGVSEEGKTSPREEGAALNKLEVDPDQVLTHESFFSSDPDDVASIIYTSGTTGRSKGVMLTHQNILSNAMQSRSIHEVTEEDHFLSILPLAHTYECTIGMMVPLLNGATIHYMDGPPVVSTLAPLLKRLAPTTMLTVPLIIEKIYRSKIRPTLYRSAVTRRLMKIGITRRLLSRIAVRKLLKFFGGRLRFFGVGGAPLAPDVEKFLIEGGFPYAIGYGLTETSPLLAGFGPSSQTYRSVGLPLEGVTLKIHRPDPVTREGEIVAKGPNIMKGYYRDEEKTAEVFTGDGYFRTGDLGYMDRKGILYVRGRSKNMILGPNGENIYPEEIEAVINSREFVNESLVMQYGGKLVARVHLNLELLEERLQHMKENAADFQHHLQARADEILEEILEQVNESLARNSRLQKMIRQIQPFEKTPTQKIKRFLYNGPTQ
ncbi:MAG: AMP-binding protein [Bacteroidales bacterium]